MHIRAYFISTQYYFPRAYIEMEWEGEVFRLMLSLLPTHDHLLSLIPVYPFLRITLILITLFVYILCRN